MNKTSEKDASIKLAGKRMNMIEMAEAPWNISKACRRGGMDRTSFHERKRRFQTHGPDGLIDLPPIPKSRPNAASPENEAMVTGESPAPPSWGCVKLSDQLKLKDPDP